MARLKRNIGNENRLVLLLVLPVLLGMGAGCASQRAMFRPVGTDPVGKPSQAGVYHTLQVDDKTIGKARVWSRGIVPRSEEPSPVLHVGIRIRNDSENEIRLDLQGTELELQSSGGNTVVVQEVEEVSGSTQVPADATGRIELLYALPQGMKARQISGFELNWVVQSQGRQVSMATPFYNVRGRRWLHAHHVVPYWNLWFPFWFYYPGWFYASWTPYYRYWPWYPGWSYFPYRTFVPSVVRVPRPPHRYRPRRRSKP